MDFAFLQDFFLVCTLINSGILLFWLLMFSLARDWVRRLHGHWFELSKERFDAIHYQAMAFFKLSIFMFNLVPYIALRILN